MARDGLGIIIGMVLFTAVIVWGALMTPYLFVDIVAVLGVLLAGLTVYFFRDPEREVPTGSNNVISPADGKVVEIEDAYEGDFMKCETTRIGIFLNVFDVHVNRIPISGSVEFFRYKKGAFLQAYKADASDINEQTVIGIQGDERKVLFKQIAGLIARRIVCHVREGNKVTLGDRFGMIKFGSRVDIFLPKNVNVQVELNQKVKGGKSILGVFTDEV